MIKGTKWEGTCLPKAGTRSDICGSGRMECGAYHRTLLLRSIFEKHKLSGAREISLQSSRMFSIWEGSETFWSVCPLQLGDCGPERGQDLPKVRKQSYGRAGRQPRPLTDDTGLHPLL